MLKAITCDAFRSFGQQKKTITFKMGLNVILGDENSSNSIGKSTLLMMIDFCFGGDDYIDKEKNTINHIGPHSVCFEFVFHQTSKYFKRKTNCPNRVEICNCNYHTMQIISLEQFRLYLLESYELDHYCLSFRQWISPFFRIYNRKTYNELRPINAHVRETDNSGIINLLKMFDAYKELEEQNKIFSYQRDLKLSLDNLSRFHIAPIAETKEEYETAQKELMELKEALENLEKDNLMNSSDFTFVEIERKTYLNKERNKLRKKKHDLELQISEIDFDESYDEKKFARNFETLKTFFPDANIEKMKDLEKFHKDVTQYVKKNMEDTNQKLHQMISLLDDQIQLIEKELFQYEYIPNVSIEFFNRHKELEKLITNHELLIENYEKKKNADIQYKIAKTAFEKIVLEKTAKVEKYLNQKMDVLNSSIREKEKKYSPVFQLNHLSSYAFFTPNDTGTGTRFKSVCLLDLAILEGTKLPALVHDSIMFTNIENQTSCDLMKLYSKQTRKQIFVALDNPSKYQETDSFGNPFNIAKENQVIQLFENEGSLFGRQ